MDKVFTTVELKGLSEAEVAERRKSEGLNELPQGKKRNFFALLFEVVKEPMFLLLIACGILYLLLGDTEEALMLLGFVIVVIGITLYQENKTEKALDALRDLSSPRALVLRDGIHIRIAGREVVRDDIILLAEGDRVPADALVLQSVNLSADESLLTGESVPVRKTPWDGVSKTGRPGGDGNPAVYSGSLIVQGQGIARVVATGVRTEMGKIGKSLQELKTESTPLQKQTGKIVKTFSIAGAILCVSVVVIFGLTRGNWLEGFLAGLSLAMATLPEEFPMVLTVFLALGAWRISKRNVLTRRPQAIETLGSATVLCTDKTGTLTCNRMTVVSLSAGGTIHAVGTAENTLPEELHGVVEYSILASPENPFDPMEKAMRELGERTLADTEHIHSDWHLIREYPLTEKLLAMSRVWESPDGEHYVIASKGAPEAIADLCHLDAAQTAALRRDIDKLADDGLRVIGVAAAEFDKRHLPEIQHDFPFRFLGLLGLEDPVRETVPEAVGLCHRAGIRVLMITGDYPGTARNIARRIGLKNADDVLTGPEIDALDDEALSRRLSGVSVIARAVPEQKLKIVQALKALGETVAMTGDGVNDAPALKAAHIGIAMGSRGTDVARESSALVLLDDDFSSIVQAVKLGRRIFDNLQKAMTFIFSVHLPIAGLSLIPVLLKWPLALHPVHILFLELIIDPACSIVFEMEQEESNVMDRPPRKREEPLFGRRMIFTGLVQGLGTLILVTLIYWWALKSGLTEGQARALAFTNLVFGNLAMIFANRYWSQSVFSTLKRKNASLWVVAGVALGVLALTLFVPFFNELFRFGTLQPIHFLICLGTGLTILMINEIAKLPALLKYRRTHG